MRLGAGALKQQEHKSRSAQDSRHNLNQSRQFLSESGAGEREEASKHVAEGVGSYRK